MQAVLGKESKTIGKFLDLVLNKGEGGGRGVLNCPKCVFLALKSRFFLTKIHKKKGLNVPGGQGVTGLGQSLKIYHFLLLSLRNIPRILTFVSSSKAFTFLLNETRSSYVCCYDNPC